MKTYHLKDLLKKDLLILELPEKTADFSVLNTGDAIAVCAFDEYDECLDVKSVSKDYTLLGKADEIREEDAKALVEFDYNNEKFTERYLERDYKNYSGKGKVYFETATESLLSAIESVIFWENPIGNEPELEAICCGNSQEDAWGHPQCCGVPNATEESIELHSMWHEAELHTFDRSRSIILAKQ